MRCAKGSCKILDINTKPSRHPPLIAILYIRARAIYIYIYYIPIYSKIISANPCFVKSSDLFCFKVTKKNPLKHTRGVYLQQRFLLPPSVPYSTDSLKKKKKTRRMSCSVYTNILLFTLFIIIVIIIIFGRLLRNRETTAAVVRRR